jgi:hypothetical protein
VDGPEAAAAAPPWGPAAAAGLFIPPREAVIRAGGRCGESGSAGGVAVAGDPAEPLTWVPGVAEGTACLRRSAGRDASPVPPEKPASDTAS